MESFRTFSSLELVRANACNRYVNILHSIGMRQHQLHFDGVIASRWDAYLFCYLCRHFASVMLHFASLISHNLRCIPAYTHQIPTEFHHKSSLGQLVYQFQKIRCVRFRNSKCSEHIDGKVIIGGTIFARSYFLKFKEMGGNTNKLKRK